MPKVGMAAVRKPQLINATLEAIDKVGLAHANVAMISRYAGVTPAIINHYFGGKSGLLDATMRHIMLSLSQAINERLALVPEGDVVGRVMAVVEGNFCEQQVESKVAKTWLTFWAQAMHEPTLYRLQRVNEQRLLSFLRRELKAVLPHQQAAFVAQGLAALIDGIWLRSALNPGGIDRDLAREIISDSLRKQLPARVWNKHLKLVSNS
ncbi:MAG: transcriptional regulator BetI [Granulosicoccaceae bacterium]